MTIIIHCAQQLATFHRGCSANGTDCTHLFLPEISQHGAVARGNCLQIVPQVFLINVRILVFGFFCCGLCVFCFVLFFTFGFQFPRFGLVVRKEQLRPV